MANRGPVASLSIPVDWEDVTPAWMTSAIAGRHPDAKVSNVTIVTRDDGTNRRARFGLTYAAGSGPRTVFAKAEDGAHREVHARNGNLFNEVQLFASGVPLGVDHPLVYAAIIDRPGLDWTVVMEDLTARGADPRDATRPMSVEQVANAVRGLARLHSRYWGFSVARHPELAWVQPFEPTEGWQVGLKARIPLGLERAAGALPAEVSHHDAEEIVGSLWVRYITSFARGPRTLLHGDPHIGNTYVLPDGDVGFLDWEVARSGHWSHDLGYFVVGALTEEDRRRSEADLVEEYRRSLDVPDDERPSAGEAWLRYRASAAHGLAIWLSTLGTDGWQSRDVSITLARRYSAAFAELDTVTALDQIDA
jgi:sulfur transfer complex TusBCD TusB component (DsrH family)